MDKHFLSESAIWQTTSEFVTPDGKISQAKGESVISVRETEIINESWAQLDDIRRSNNYKITPVSPSEFISESLNPELGKQIGTFNVDRNTIFSKFKIEGTALNGYEIIRRERDTCYTQGALYDNDSLINTWTATMSKNSMISSIIGISIIESQRRRVYQRADRHARLGNAHGAPA